MSIDCTPHGNSDKVGLRRNYLSGYELTFQSVGTVAPSASMALLVPVIFAAAGVGTWLTIAVAGAGILFLAGQMAIFGRRMASPGALYAYVHAGLGPLPGVVAGGSVLLAYLLFVATIPPQIANLVSGQLYDHFRIPASLELRIGLMTASVLLPWWLARRDIKLSTQATCLIEVATMLLLIVLVSRHFWLQGAWPSRAQLSLHGFTIGEFYRGLVLAFLLYGGFETAMELGTEARDPFSVIPRILVTVVGLLTGFFLFMGYGTVGAFEDLNHQLATDISPMTTLAGSMGWNTAGFLVTFGIFSSLMASSVGCINAASRVLYAFAHRGVFSRALAVTHPVYATPHRSIAAVSTVGLGIAVALTVAGVQPLAQLSYIGTMSSISILAAYALVVVAAPCYLKTLGLLRVRHIAGAIVALGFLLLPLAGSVYPVPDYPLDLIPYLYLAVMVAGAGWFVYARHRHPDRLQGMEDELLELPNPASVTVTG